MVAWQQLLAQFEGSCTGLVVGRRCSVLALYGNTQSSVLGTFAVLCCGMAVCSARQHCTVVLTSSTVFALWFGGHHPRIPQQHVVQHMFKLPRG
jgi:hypothetical protein